MVTSRLDFDKEVVGKDDLDEYQSFHKRFPRSLVNFLKNLALLKRRCFFCGEEYHRVSSKLGRIHGHPVNTHYCNNLRLSLSDDGKEREKKLIRMRPHISITGSHLPSILSVHD